MDTKMRWAIKWDGMSWIFLDFSDTLVFGACKETKLSEKSKKLAVTFNTLACCQPNAGIKSFDTHLPIILLNC